MIYNDDMTLWAEDVTSFGDDTRQYLLPSRQRGGPDRARQRAQALPQPVTIPSDWAFDKPALLVLGNGEVVEIDIQRAEVHQRMGDVLTFSITAFPRECFDEVGKLRVLAHLKELLGGVRRAVEEQDAVREMEVGE